MRKFTFTFLFLISFKANAAFWIEISNPCVNVASIFEEVDVFAPATVSNIVQFFFPTFAIPYQATESHIIHIFNTPTDEEAIEWISNDHYRVYGWCYSVDGVIPDVTMDQYVVDPLTTKRIQWFYGFAEYQNGNWLNYCEPLYNHPDQFICTDLFN